MLHSGNSAGGVVVSNLTISIVRDEAHIEWRVTTRVLRRRLYASVRIRNRLAIVDIGIGIGIAVRTHREVSKDGLVEWRF